jgi:hypothetical protein
MEPARPRHSYLREGAAVVAGSLLASIAFTWPLVLHLQSRARDLVDTLFQAWTIDWVQHAIGSGLNPYNANIFAPEKTSLAFSDTLLGVAIPTFPLRWLGMTPIGVLNVTIIVGFAASAAAAYLFARVAGGSRLLAAVAGAAYAFGPFGALAARHVHVAVRPGVPLAAAAARPLPMAQSVSITFAGGPTNGDITIRVKGLNQFAEPITQDYTSLSGQAAGVVTPLASLTTTKVFRKVTSVQVVSNANTAAATISVGSSANVAQFKIGIPVKIVGKVDRSSIRGTLGKGGETLYVHTSGGSVSIAAAGGAI